MAVLLTWVLFVGWATVGLAVLKLGRFRWTVTTLLLAPTVGFATFVVFTYLLIRFGVPVRFTAVPIGVVFLALALAALWRARPAAAHAWRLWKRSRAFGVVLVGTFGLTAWPLIGYGFDWVANGNDDMANYCLTATGYREHAFVEVPTVEDLHEGRDQSRAYWFFYILLQIRSGAEMLLALTSIWTGLSAQQVFMPVTVALNMSLVAAVGALAVAGTRRRWAGVLAGGMLGVSAASTYGVVQQLIAQVGGLALLCASLALVAGRFRRLRAGVLLRRSAACGVVFTALLVFYPEVTPILVGGCVALGLRDLARGRLDRRHLAHASAAITVMVALMPVYLVGAASFLAVQSGSTGASDASAETFPYYLSPRGPALLWGLLPIAGPESAAMQNASIVLGFVLLVAVAVPTVTNFRGRRAFAAALVVFAALTAVLYAQRAAFGLFKIAMFAQPFLWAVVAAWVVGRRTRWAVAGATVGLVAVAGLNARTQFWYVNQSRGHEYRVELPAVTTRHALTGFRTAYAQRVATGEVDRVFLATENNVLLKLLAAEVRGVPIGQVGVAAFDDQARCGFCYIETSPWIRLHGDWTGTLQTRRADFAAARDRGRLTMVDPDTGRPLHRLMYPTADRANGDPHRVLVIAGGGGVSVLNRYQFPETGPVLICAPLADLRNVGVFCDATGARQHYLEIADFPDAVALYQLEGDPAFRKRTMAGVGRAMLIDVLNPTPQVRVLVSSTGSYRADPEIWRVAPVQVVGDRRVSLGTVGIGSSRLVSPLVVPQAVGPGRYIALDFGDPIRNPNQLSAAEKLWGKELTRDRRMLTGHLRDISVLSEEDYAVFRPPQQIVKFPADLAHPHLEYSGLYEDGWIGTEFKVRLTQPEPGQEAVIRGMVPQVGDATGFRTEMTVLLDGKVVENRMATTSDFEVRIPSAIAGPRWIEVRFSNDQTLPAPDGRRAVAHLKFVGFEPISARSRAPEQLAAFPADLKHPKLEQSGISLDGWCAKTFTAQLWQTEPGRDAVVRGMIPDIAGNAAYRTELTFLVDGVEVAKRQLASGDFEVRAPSGKSAQSHRLECRFTNTQSLPPPDDRVVGALLRFVGFEATKPAP